MCNRLRNIILISFLLSILLVRAQETLNGVINSYYQVDNVGVNTVTLNAGTPPTDLNPGDKVLLVQMTGCKLFATGLPNDDGLVDNIYDAGNYELLAVKGKAGNDVEFTTASFKKTYDNSEKIQLVKIYETENAIINGTVSAQPWDGTKGGIVAVVVFKKLTLAANIDVSGQGFRGAAPVSGYSGGCQETEVHYFTTPDAGKKGEGVITTSFTYLYGPGNNYTGGSGGAGLYGGGGGGGNHGYGGRGGIQDNSCTLSLRAKRSKELVGGDPNNIEFYNAPIPRISFGGGGGSSTEDGNSASTGGNGGGMVLIITDTLEASESPQIIANGQSVSTISTAGGGGGGAGGTILLDADTYISNFTVSFHGGDGGVTSTTAGGGGGGGGGILYYKGSGLPANISSIDSAGGTGGEPTGGGSTGFIGDHGGTLNNLNLSLNGFVFNSIAGIDTICQGQQPNLLTGSTPKGDASPFTYEWISSTDSINWSLASGSGGAFSFQPDALNGTTYFTRVVTDKYSQTDTAVPIKIFVYTAIQNNIVTIVNDTICSGDTPGTLAGGVLTGGNGTYTYTWIASEDQTSWTNVGSGANYVESELTTTTYYHRIIQSAVVCVDTSEIKFVRVLDPIGGNEFVTTDTVICQGVDAGILLPSAARYGDGVYRYSWFESDDDNTYSIIAGETDAALSPGVLYAEKYYKRVVASGKNDACLDTTLAKHVATVDSIKNNLISTDSLRYCAGDTPNNMNGPEPEDGGGNYSYQWIQNTGSGWQSLNDGTSQNHTFSGIIEDTTLFARVVTGNNSVCIDTSNYLLVDVIPYINNQLETENENICEDQQPQPFTEEVATGGAGTYSYQWQQSTDGNSWSITVGTADQTSYSPPTLNITTFYRREVYSEICQQYSDTLIITVYPYITDNIIIGDNIQYTCYGTPAELSGESPGGGSGSYTYSWQQSVNNFDWTDGSGTANNQNYNSEPLVDTAYFRRLVFSGETQQCKDTSEPVLVRINPLPVGSMISGIDTVCAGQLITVGYSFEGNGPWNIQFGNESGEEIYSRNDIMNAEDTIQFALFETAEVQILELEDINGCFATDLSGTLDVQVYSNPEATPGNMDSICGLEYSLNASLSVQDELSFGYWFANEGEFDNLNSPNAYYTVPTYGEKTLIWTEVNWQCADAADLQLIFFEQPVYSNAGEDQKLDYFFETNLDAELPEIGAGTWTTGSDQANIIDPLSENTKVTFDFGSIGSHAFIWTVRNGVCPVVTDSMSVSINDLEVYHGFSPNGDNINDEFILNLSGQKEVELLILSRYGLEVYRTTGVDKIKWDGKNSNGDDLPTGTYFYIIKEDGATKDNGYIELRR